MPTIIASYAESNRTSGGELSGNVTSLGQCFTANGYQLTSVKFYLKKDGGAMTGSMFAKVYAITGSFGSTAVPTGAVLATSAGLDPNTTTGAYVLYEFFFTGANSIVLNNGTNYFVVLEHLGQTAPNAINMGYNDTGSPVGPGNLAVQVSGSWTPVANFFTCFYVYGVPVDVTVNLTGVAGSPAIGTGTVVIEGGVVPVISHATEGIRHDRKKKKVVPEIYEKIYAFDTGTYLEGVSAISETGIGTTHVGIKDQLLTCRYSVIDAQSLIHVSYETGETPMPVVCVGSGSFKTEADLYWEEIAAILGE